METHLSFKTSCPMMRLSGESTPTSTSAMAESLTEDMVIEILLRLPAKSLMRFKCVSKRWQSLISDPGFAKSHLQRLQTGDIISSQRIFKTSPFETINYEALDRGIGDDDDRAVVRFHGPSIDFYSCDGSCDGCDPVVVGSCDGLVCLYVCIGFILYNPTTKESRKLPDCDLFQTGLSYGFGYDSRSDDYKIVYHMDPEDCEYYSRECEVAIFSLKSGSWRRAQAQFEGDLSVFTEQKGVYWNGALHWVFIDEAMFESFIISFNLSEEKFEQVLSIPQIYDDDDDESFMRLGIHGDYLSIFYSTDDECLQVWITSEYREGGSWSKLFSVSTEGIPDDNHWGEIPIAYTRSGKIVFKVGARMILFNPEDNTYRDYPIQSGGIIDSVIYEETLVSPYLGSELSRI